MKPKSVSEKWGSAGASPAPVGAPPTGTAVCPLANSLSYGPELSAPLSQNEFSDTL